MAWSELPVVACWRGDRIKIIAGELIPAADERAMAAVLGRWLETYLLSNSENLGPQFVNVLRRSPVENGSPEQRLPETIVSDLPVLGAWNGSARRDDHAFGREA